MKIDLSKMEMYWFEDADGNRCDSGNEKAEFYHHCFPCEISHKIDSYGFHPHGALQKTLCKIKPFKKMLEKKHGKTFKPLVTFTTTYGSEWSQKTIVNMVNSGDYSLEQAIWVYTSACERCMNALIHKYAPELNDGYEEHSEEWEKCGTICDFCRDESETDVARDGEEKERA